MMAAPRSSLRALVGSDESMNRVLEFLGPVGDLECMEAEMGFEEALGLARTLPGVALGHRVRLGAAGAQLLLAHKDALSNASLAAGSSWSDVFRVASCGGLRTLALWRCDLSVSDAEALATALCDGSWLLEELNVSLNPRLGDTGCSALADALPHCRTLRVVKLRGLGMGNLGAKAVANAMASTELRATVEELNLASNPLGAVGVWSLGDALKSNTGLRTLGLWDCNINSSMAFIFNALRPNSTLRKLYLTGNGLAVNTTSGAEGIASALHSSSLLHVLHLMRVPMDTWGLALANLEDNKVHTTGWLEGRCVVATRDRLTLTAAA